MIISGTFGGYECLPSDCQLFTDGSYHTVTSYQVMHMMVLSNANDMLMICRTMNVLRNVRFTNGIRRKNSTYAYL